MATWRAAAFLATTLALAAAAACSSFESVDEAPGDAGVGGDSATDAPASDGAVSIDAGSDATKTSRIYVFGGYSDEAGTVPADSLSAEVLEDGGLGAWTPVAELGSPRYFAATAVTSDGRIVHAAGSRINVAPTPNEGATKSVDTASLDPISKLTAAAPLEFDLQTPAGASQGPWVFVTGGQSSSTITRNEVFVSSFDVAGGPLLPWRKTDPLPSSTTRHAAATLREFLFVVGGGFIEEGSFVAVSESRRGTIATDGSVGGWVTTTSLPEPVWMHGLASVKGHLFSIGGRQANSGTTANVHVATPNAQGDLTWLASTPLPEPLAGACTVVANDRIFVLGGFKAFAEGGLAKIFIGAVGDTGSLGWSESAVPLPSGRAGHGCAAF